LASIALKLPFFGVIRIGQAIVIGQRPDIITPDESLAAVCTKLVAEESAVAGKMVMIV